MDIVVVNCVATGILLSIGHFSERRHSTACPRWKSSLVAANISQEPLSSATEPARAEAVRGRSDDGSGVPVFKRHALSLPLKKVPVQPAAESAGLDQGGPGGTSGSAWASQDFTYLGRTLCTRTRTPTPRARMRIASAG